MATTFADLLEGDLVSMSTLSHGINRVNPSPFLLEKYIKFVEKPISTNSVAIEERSKKLTVIPSSARGTVGKANRTTRRKMRRLEIPHYQEFDSILASEFQNVRDFGDPIALASFQKALNEKLDDMRANLEVTKEFARAGAIQNVIFDADGSVIYDLHDEFETNPTTHVINITDPTVDLREEFVAVKRKSEAHLGGYVVKDFPVFMPAEMFDAAIKHASLKTAYERYLEGAAFREDLRTIGLRIATNVILMSYEPNGLEGLPFIDPEKSICAPNAEGLFKAWYGPADNDEWVGKPGLPLFAMSERMKFGKGAELAAETNYLPINENPPATVEITWS